jgi:hypothetical protein
MTALFLLQWLRAVEEVSDISAIGEEEKKVYTLISDLLAEAVPDQDASEQPTSRRFITVKAYAFDGVNVWGSKLFSDEANYSCTNLVTDLWDGQRGT